MGAHFTTKMIGETTVGVKDREIRATNITNAQFLVTRRARSICQLLKVSLERKVEQDAGISRNPYPV